MALAQPLVPPRLRRPIAAAWIENGRLLAVANQRSGTVSVVDIPKRQVIDEIEVGERLADIEAIPKTNRLLAVDSLRHELIMLEWRRTTLFPLSRTPVSPYPVDIAIAHDGSVFSIASLWSRKVTVWEKKPCAAYDELPYHCHDEVNLPFNPRQQYIPPYVEQVIVADAFGGNLAVIDLKTPKLLTTRTIHGHNLRGLASSLNPGHLLIAHQRLLPTPATAENIRAGSVIENLLGEYSQPGLLPAEKHGPLRGFTTELGGEDGGRADPAGVVAISRDRTLVAIAGHDELRMLPEFGMPPFTSVSANRGPRTIVLAGFGQPAMDPFAPFGNEPPEHVDIILNPISDSLSLIAWHEDRADLPETVDPPPTVKPRAMREPMLKRKSEPELERSPNLSPPRRGEPKIVGEISLGPSPLPKPADRGEALFYDARLSAHGWMSCHSCHTDGHTNGQLADTLGDGTHGTPKRIPTLLGTRLTDKWAWNGEVRELHEQISKSLENTMHAPDFTPEQVMDLTAYLHTLPFPPPLQPATKEPEDQKQLSRGEHLFTELGCAKCHVPPLTYTSPDAYDVGLADEKGLTKFNPPSLRGVSQGYSFFHDGRAKALEEVFTVHGHQLPRELEPGERKDLLRFLRSL